MDALGHLVLWLSVFAMVYQICGREILVSLYIAGSGIAFNMKLSGMISSALGWLCVLYDFAHTDEQYFAVE